MAGCHSIDAAPSVNSQSAPLQGVLNRLKRRREHLNERRNWVRQRFDSADIGKAWFINPVCTRCGKKTNPEGVHPDRPKLAKLGNRDVIVCRECESRQAAIIPTPIPGTGKNPRSRQRLAMLAADPHCCLCRCRVSADGGNGTRRASRAAPGKLSCERCVLKVKAMAQPDRLVAAVPNASKPVVNRLVAAIGSEHIRAAKDGLKLSFDVPVNAEDKASTADEIAAIGELLLQTSRQMVAEQAASVRARVRSITLPIISVPEVVPVALAVAATAEQVDTMTPIKTWLYNARGRANIVVYFQDRQSGRRRQISTGTKDQAEAERFAADLQVRFSSELPPAEHQPEMYLPSLEEIATATAEIRAGWTRDETLLRWRASRDLATNSVAGRRTIASETGSAIPVSLRMMHTYRGERVYFAFWDDPVTGDEKKRSTGSATKAKALAFADTLAARLELRYGNQAELVDQGAA